MNWEYIARPTSSIVETNWRLDCWKTQSTWLSTTFLETLLKTTQPGFVEDMIARHDSVGIAKSINMLEKAIEPSKHLHTFSVPCEQAYIAFVPPTALQINQLSSIGSIRGAVVSFIRAQVWMIFGFLTWLTVTTRQEI